MTTAEAHILLDILLQDISSFSDKNFLSQEKDLLINTQINKFIKNRINVYNDKQQSIFDIKKRIGDVTNLIETIEIPVQDYNTKEVKALLPFDYNHYISSSAEVVLKCKPVEKTNNVTDVTVTFPHINNVEFNNINNLTIKLIEGNNIITLFDILDYPNYLPNDNGLLFKKQVILNNLIFKVLNRKLLKGYTIKNNTKYNEFKINNLKDFNILITLNNNIIPITKDSNTIKVIDKIGSIIPLDVIDEEFKTVINKSYLSSPNTNKGNVIIRGDMLILPINKDVIYRYITLSYLKKPKLVDLILNYNSDLSSSTLEEVIHELAVFIKSINTGDLTALKNNIIIE